MFPQFGRLYKLALPCRFPACCFTCRHCRALCTMLSKNAIRFTLSAMHSALSETQSYLLWRFSNEYSRSLAGLHRVGAVHRFYYLDLENGELQMSKRFHVKHDGPSKCDAFCTAVGFLGFIALVFLMLHFPG